MDIVDFGIGTLAGRVKANTKWNYSEDVGSLPLFVDTYKNTPDGNVKKERLIIHNITVADFDNDNKHRRNVIMRRKNNATSIAKIEALIEKMRADKFSGTIIEYLQKH